MLWLRRRDAGGRSDDVPELDARDPYEIALLRRGAPEALRAAAFALLERGQLEPTEGGCAAPGAGWCRRTHSRRPCSRSSVPGNPARALFAAELEQSCLGLRESLERDGLRLAKAAHRERRRIGALIGFALATLAGLQIARALTVGRTHMLFLIALCAATGWGVHVRVRSARTRRGQAALRALQARLRERPVPAQGGAVAGAADSGELALLVAALGIGVLPGALYGSIPERLPYTTGVEGIGGSCSEGCGEGGS